MSTRRKQNHGTKKVAVSPGFKRAMEKGRRELAEGKGVPLADLLVEALKRDARKHAA